MVWLLPYWHPELLVAVQIPYQLQFFFPDSYKSCYKHLLCCLYLFFIANLVQKADEVISSDFSMLIFRDLSMKLHKFLDIFYWSNHFLLFQYSKFYANYYPCFYSSLEEMKLTSLKFCSFTFISIFIYTLLSY